MSVCCLYPMLFRLYSHYDEKRARVRGLGRRLLLDGGREREREEGKDKKEGSEEEEGCGTGLDRERLWLGSSHNNYGVHRNTYYY